MRLVLRWYCKKTGPPSVTVMSWFGRDMASQFHNTKTFTIVVATSLSSSHASFAFGCMWEGLLASTYYFVTSFYSNYVFSFKFLDSKCLAQLKAIPLAASCEETPPILILVVWRAFTSTNWNRLSSSSKTMSSWAQSSPWDREILRIAYRWFHAFSYDNIFAYPIWFRHENFMNFGEKRCMQLWQKSLK